jgi:hypothetical protein
MENMTQQRIFISGLLGSVLLLSACGAAPVAAGSGVPSVILDVFPESVAQMPADQQGRTVMSGNYTPTSSLWGKHLDESTVFHHEIKHLQGEDNAFNLRIGKGGQLYSLRGAFGESIPPQGVGSPWNDEVWQFVAVCGKYHFGLRNIEHAGAVSEEVVKRFKQSPYSYTYFIHNSGAYMPISMNSGRVTLTCDVLLDKKSPGKLDLILKDTTGESRREIGTIGIEAKGIRFGSKQIAPCQVGAWYNISLSFNLGKEDRKRGILTVKGNGRETTEDVALTDPTFTKFNWLGFSAVGRTGLINIDNLSVKRVTEKLTDWAIKEDFEDYTAGQEFGYVPGRDKTKGSDGFVSDRIALSGSNSLEIHDGTDGWAPMVRLDVGTSIARNLYCPLLGVDLPDDGRTYRTVNWGFVPQLKTLHRSPLLYYVQTRDVGDGVIEVTYVVHNFSVREDIVFDWLNAPWGGTRITSLPFHYVSSPDGKLVKDPQNAGLITDVRETGGWNLSCATEEPDSPSLALVFGRDKNLESELQKKEQGLPHCQFAHSLYRDWTTYSEDRNNMPPRREQDWRNYDVAVVIPKFRLTPGTTIWYRSYLVINSKDRTIELAKALVDKVDYGLRVFDPETTPEVPVTIGKDGKVSRPTEKGTRSVGRSRPRGESGFPSFSLFAHPVPGTMPLFLIENAATGQEVITTDPYVFVPQEKLNFGLPTEHPHADYYNEAIGYSLDKNNSKWKRLLGYAYIEKPKSGTWQRLSTAAGKSLVAKPSKFNLDLWVKKPATNR